MTTTELANERFVSITTFKRNGTPVSTPVWVASENGNLLVISSRRNDMKALVVYESMYGNTAAIGEAIAAALREQRLEVEAKPISKVEPEQTTDVDLLVVGGPTHVHGMSRNSSRKTAAADEKNTFAEPTLEPGLRTWLAQLPEGAGRLAAAFDTRIDKPLILTGSAAKGIGRGLKGRGFHLVTEPECFLVSTQNRLLEGELEHAATWGTKIAERVSMGEAVARTDTRGSAAR